MPSSDAYLSATTSGGTSPGDPPSSQWVRVGDGRACGAAAGPRVAVLTRLLRLGRPWEVAGRGSGQQGQPAPLSGATSRDPVFHLWRGRGHPSAPASSRPGQDDVSTGLLVALAPGRMQSLGPPGSPPDGYRAWHPYG